MPSKKSPRGAALEIKPLCAEQLACHLLDGAAADHRKGQVFQKKP